MTVALNHTEAGRGVPLVLLHAFPLSSDMWAAQREGLADVYRVVTPDQRGFGRSPLDGDRASDDPPSLDAAADDVAALLDRLALDRVVLGGMSMGGYVAMAFVARYPDRVAGLVLADTKAGADPPEVRDRQEQLAVRATEPGGMAELMRDFVRMVVGPYTVEHRPEVVERIRRLVGAARPEAFAWASRAMAARRDSTGVLRGVDVPALVVVGEDDQLTPVADAEALAELLPRARLVRIPSSGHLPAIEDPAAFDAAVREFAAEVR
jgi:pimeloyl-ACP methyl ester carboxylesterase